MFQYEILAYSIHAKTKKVKKNNKFKTSTPT